MKKFYFSPILIIFFLTTCEEDRSRLNPIDPKSQLYPWSWAPSNLQAEMINDSQIKLTWSQEDTRISGFRISRSEDNVIWPQIAEVGKDTLEYLDTGLDFSSNYNYKVKAFSGDNESTAATVFGSTIFPPPTNLVAVPINDQTVYLSWTDNSSFEAGFRILRSHGSGDTQIAETNADIIEFNDEGIIYITNDHTYKVKAFTLENESAYTTSNTVSTELSSPTNLVATHFDEQSINLTWDDNNGYEIGYILERYADGGDFAVVAELDADATQYLDTGLILGTTYSYRIKTLSEIQQSDYSSPATVNFWIDCDGVWGGQLEPDCNGVCGGTAYINLCDVCAGGNTGLDERNCEPITDIDGNEYQTVIIGNQVWTAENLKVSHYRNGDEILFGTSTDDWTNAHADSYGAYCFYDNVESIASVYGYFYNQFAVASGVIAPEGWHIPSESEWAELIDFLGAGAGGKLKEEGTDHWEYPNVGATNESGFTVLGAGYRIVSGTFSAFNTNTYFWSSTTYEGGQTSVGLRLTNGSQYHSLSYYNRGYGFSVRCIKD